MILNRPKNMNINDDDDVCSMYKNLSEPNVLGINCGDYGECSFEFSTLNYTNKAICCTETKHVIHRL